jgi:hypothetical protein
MAAGAEKKLIALAPLRKGVFLACKTMERMPRGGEELVRLKG